MDKITAMIEKRRNTWDAAKAFLNAKRGTDGTLSAEDAATYDAMEAEVVNLGKEIDRLQRQETIDQMMNAPTSTPMTTKPQNDGMPKKGSPRATDEYRSSFNQFLRNRAPSYEVLNALQIGTDSEGGYLAPDEFDRQIIQALTEQNLFRTVANVFTTASGDRKIPVVTAEGTASWIDEEGEIPESDPTFGIASLSAYKLGTMVKVSEELLNDAAFNLEAYIAGEFARRCANKEEQAFMVGDGSGKPTGLFHTTGGAGVGVTAASSSVFTADELIDLFYGLKAPYRSQARWLLNDATIKNVRKLKDGEGQYLWQPALTAGAPDMLLNRPILTSAYAPTIAAGARVIAFGDFKYYWIADRSARTIKRLNELYAKTDQVGFKCTQRLDGKLILAEAVKALAMKA
jgi:HK97 family phage major capsid protein